MIRRFFNDKMEIPTWLFFALIIYPWWGTIHDIIHIIRWAT